MDSRLPNDVIALIHHIELTKAGWWDRAVEKFIVGAIWIQGPIRMEELHDSLRTAFALEIATPALRESVGRLVERGELLSLADGRLKLSEHMRAQVGTDIADTNEQRKSVAAYFLSELTHFDVEHDPSTAWEQFESELLVPLVKELGARTFELLVPGEAGASDIQLQRLVSGIAADKGESYLRAVVAFLNPQNPEVRAYVLRALNAYLFTQAGALDAQTLERVQATGGKTPEFKVFVDTNFLFSVLRLHENPANEAAEALDALLARIRNRVNVQLFALPITIEETRKVLDACITGLSGIRLPANVAEALADRPELPGLTQKFAQEAAKSSRVLTSEEFFGPYAHALVTVLRERGVELYNEKLDSYRTDQAVIDDVMEQEEFQKRYRARGPKAYETNLHDVVLWHVVSRKRPIVAESPAEVCYWVVTEDYGFLGFDRYKRQSRNFPICLLPTSLLQLLQFFVPRDDEFDAAVVGSVRLPFLFAPFDIDSERVTIRILRSLSRYEGIQDFSPNTIARLLGDEALRGHLREEPTEVKDDALLREAFVQETLQMEQRLNATQAELREEREKGESLRAQLARELEDPDSSNRLKATLAELEGRVQSLVKKNEEMRTEFEAAQTATGKLLSTRAKSAFIALWTLSLLVACVLGLGAWLALRPLEWPTWVTSTAAATIALLAWLLAGEALATKFNLGTLRLMLFLRKVRVALWAGFAALALSALGAAVWDSIRSKS